MRYRIRAGLTEPIPLTATLDPAAGIEAGDGVSYQFITDPLGFRLTHLVASVVTDPRGHETRLQPSPLPGLDYEVVWKPDVDQRNHLVDSLDILSAHLAFIAGSLAKVDWASAEESLVAESDDERAQLAVSSVSVRRTHPDVNARLDPRLLPLLIREKLAWQRPLGVLRAFYREATREYWRYNWIPAVRDYYFIIEGLYANGENSEQGVALQGLLLREAKLNGTPDRVWWAPAQGPNPPPDEGQIPPAYTSAPTSPSPGEGLPDTTKALEETFGHPVEWHPLESQGAGRWPDRSATTPVDGY